MALGFYQLAHLLLVASVVEAATGRKKGRGGEQLQCAVVLLELRMLGQMELGAAAQRISVASDWWREWRLCSSTVVFAASLDFSVSFLLLSPVVSKAEQNLASSECLAPLSAIAYAKTFSWSCLKCSYNYRVHIYSHPLPLTLWYLVLGIAFPENHPACCWCFLPSSLSHCSPVWESSLPHPADLLMLSQDWFQTGNQEKWFLKPLIYYFGPFVLRASKCFSMEVVYVI